MTGPLMPAGAWIGPLFWTIEAGPEATLALREDHDDEAIMGDCDVTRTRIRVSMDLGPTAQRETLLHEILHACQGVIGRPLTWPHGKDADLEEIAVATLSPILLSTLRTNGALTAYLFD